MKQNITQEQLVLNYLKGHDNITSYEAVAKLGILDLPKRVSVLKKEGIILDKKRVNRLNRFGNHVSYIEYSLKKEVA